MSIPAVDLGVQAEEVNLLTNGTFEDSNEDGKADGWSYYSTTANPEASSEINSDGLKIVSKSTTVTERLTVHRTVQNLSAGTYRFTGYIKVSNLSAGKVNLYCTANSDQRTSFVTYEKATDGWVQFAQDVTLAADGKIKVECEVYPNAALTAEIKQFGIYAITDDNVGETNLLPNGDFLIDSDFDGKADGWSYYYNDGTRTECASEITEDGIKITAVSGTTNERLTVHQTVQNLSAGKYKFTGKVNISEYNSGHVNLYYTASGGTRYAFKTYEATTDGWTNFEQDIELTADGAIKVECEVFPGADLTICINNFSLTAVTEEDNNNSESTVFDSGLLVNGGFADICEKYTGTENASQDEKAAAWQYYANWSGAVAPKTALIENGVQVTADGTNTTDSLKERISIQQTVTGLTAGKTYRLTGSYKIETISYGKFSIDIDGTEAVAVQSSNSTEWQSFSKDITVTLDKLQVRIMTSSAAIVTACVKEFKLVEVEATAEPESNGLIQNYKYVTDDVTSIENWLYYPNTVFTNNNATVAVEDGAITATLNNTSQLNINQTVKLTDTSAYGKYYVVTGKVKTTGLSSNAYLRVQLLNKSFSTANSDYMWNSTKYKGTNDWQDVTVVFPVPATIGTTEIGGFKVEQIIDKGNGTASFKDLKAYVTDYTYDASNLIINPDYVNSGDLSSITPWTYYPTDVLSNNKVTVAVSENDEFSATLNGSSNIYLYQTVKLDTTDSSNFGVYYKITGEIKTSDLSNNAYLRAQLVNASNSQISASYVWTSEKYKGTNDWTTITMYIPVPASVDTGSTSSVAVKGFKVEQIADKGTGTVTFRNLKAEKTSIVYDEDNILKNPQYLNGTVSDITGWSYSPVGTVGTSYDVTVNGSDNSITFEGNSTTESLTLYQKVAIKDTVTTDTIYNLTGKIKATDLTGSAVIRIRLDSESGSSLAVVKTSDVITGTTDGWVDVNFNFEVPNAYYLNATDEDPTKVGDFKVEQIVYKGNAESISGTVSFKELVVKKVSDIENNIVEGDANNSLFYNGGFERTYDGLPRWWSVWESTGGLKVSRDDTVTHTGNYSLHIENKTEGAESRGSVHQTLTDIPGELQGQSVKISQWIKASNFTGTGLTIRLQYKTNSGAAVDLTSKYVSIPENVEDTGWIYYEYILDLPSSDLIQIKLEYLYDECVGDVWIDDLQVTTYIKATGITPSADSVVLNENETEQLAVTFAPSNATVTEVTYTSSNEAVATVNDAGLITAVSEGTATIKITHVDGAEKEVAVLVSNNTFTYDKTINPINTEAGVTATGTLPEGYTYEVVAKPQYGAFVVSGTDYTYYPDAGFTGSDTVVLVVTNEEGAKALVTVNITVGAASEAPVFDDFIISTSKGTEVKGGLLATDATTASANLVYEIVAHPTNGTLTITGNTYTYTPNDDFVGYDAAADGSSVQIKVTDEDNNPTTANVTIYVAPAQSELAAQVKDGHSYLLADDTKFATLKTLIEAQNETIYPWFEDIKAAVDPLLDEEPYPAYSCPDGVRLDTQGSKDVVNLAFMYRVTGEQKYLNRAWKELEVLCDPEKYPDWHPSHLLDVAMTANGVAIAYDWLYDYLTVDQIDYVEKALYNNALVEGKYQYEDGHMFVTNGFNWNYVCNGGFATAALALMHCGTAEYEALAAEVLQLAYQSIQNGLPQYAPEGDSIEGVSYWDYGTRYLVSFLACVSSATGNNPFLDTPGLYETALYPIYMTGKDGSFNYSDNDTSDAVGYLNLWLAEAYDEPSYAWYHKYYMSQGHTAFIYDLLYYNAKYYTSEETPALDNYYSAQAVTTMRTDYTDEDSAFVGFKGGITGAPHGDLDIGTFVYDIYGIRWATDLGKENYNIGDYWNLNSGSLRWACYRKDASGHNTLVINPDASGENQTIGTYTGKIESSLNGVSGGYTILDMTSAYQDEAAEVKRGAAFIDRSQLLIRDEYVLKSVGDIYWQMHTEADISISSDGKIATLTQDGKSIEVRILGDDADLKFETMTADFYGTETETGKTVYEEVGGTGLATKDEKGRGAFTKLYVKASNVQSGSFSILLTPVDMENPTDESLDTLATWSEYDFSKFSSTNNNTSGGTGNSGSNSGTGNTGSGNGSSSSTGKDTSSNGATLVEVVTVDASGSSSATAPGASTGDSTNVILPVILMAGAVFVLMILKKRNKRTEV